MKELWQAARIGVVATYVGRLCLVIAALNSVPLLASLACGDRGVALRYLVVVLGLAAVGVISRRASDVRIQRNEGMAVAGLAFVVASVAGTYPFADHGVPAIDALFEAVSAITTTGMSALGSVEHIPESLLFARAWMQWCGGLGIVVLALALLQDPGAIARDLSVTQSSAEDVAGSTRAYARRVLVVYSALTAAGIAALALLGVGVVDAVEYALASVSTGGFAPRDGSAADLGGGGQLAIIALCLAGALPLLSCCGLRRLSRERRMDTREALTLLSSIVLFAAGLTLATWLSGTSSLGEALRQGPFLAASAHTTSGFATREVGTLDDTSKLVLILAMSIGGVTGSTAGGVKVFRLLILARVLQLVIARAALPRHAVVGNELDSGKRSDREIRRALAVTASFAVVVVASWMAFLASGHDPMDSLFDVVSATGTVGLSAGISIAGLPVLLKLVLCADMLLGRLEFVVWIVVLSPHTWWGRRAARRGPHV